MINVLYVAFASENFDGATYSLMDLIRSVKDSVRPLVLLRTKGCVYDYFQENGVECIVSYYEEDLVGDPHRPDQWVRYLLDYIPHRRRFFRRNRECAADVKRQLEGRHIDIVHINSTVCTAGFDIARALGAKTVWHLRGFMDLDFGWKPLTGWKSYRAQVARADAVIGITPTVLHHYIAEDAPHTYSIFDAVRHRDDVCFEPKKEKYFLFCAGLLSRQKGCNFALEAFARSGLAAKGYRLTVIGAAHPRYKARLDKAVVRLGIKDSVDFIGRTPDVKKYMTHATAFLMCSEHEGLGRVSVEAMYYGCLVIGRNSGGTKDFVLHEQTGLLFNTVDECAAAMQRAAGRDHTALIQQAQRYAQDHFSIEDYGEKIMAVYNDVVK